MKRVIIESPFAGDLSRNRAYLRDCILDCLARGEAPFASHVMYTTALDDLIPEQRALGIEAGFAWKSVAEATVVYEDLGISPGMQKGIDASTKIRQMVEYRSLEKWRKR